MNIKEVLSNLRLKFSSGNNISVERVLITIDEFNVILNKLSELQSDEFNITDHGDLELGDL